MEATVSLGGPPRIITSFARGCELNEITKNLSNNNEQMPTQKHTPTNQNKMYKKFDNQKLHNLQKEGMRYKAHSLQAEYKAMAKK